MQLKLDKDQKIHLIYIFEKCGKNQAKMFDFLSTHKYDDSEWSFEEHTQEQNHRFLIEWKRKNAVFFGDYEFGTKMVNNIPTIIRFKGRLA